MWDVKQGFYKMLGHDGKLHGLARDLEDLPGNFQECSTGFSFSWFLTHRFLLGCLYPRLSKELKQNGYDLYQKLLAIPADRLPGRFRLQSFFGLSLVWSLLYAYIYIYIY